MGANAQTSVPAFTAGQVLTAAQVTGINTGIPVFASSTERDAAFGGAGEKTLAEGQYAFLEDTNETQVYDGSSWGAVSGGKILQVVSTTKTDTYSASVAQGATTAITGLTASITPTSASSTVLVLAQINAVVHNAGAQSVVAVLTRGGTAICIGDASGANSRGTSSSAGADTEGINSIPVVFLDSPATTSATTYGIEIGHSVASSVNIYVNRSVSVPNNSDVWRTTSTITVLEVGA